MEKDNLADHNTALAECWNQYTLIIVAGSPWITEPPCGCPKKETASCIGNRWNYHHEYDSKNASDRLTRPSGWVCRMGSSIILW